MKIYERLRAERKRLKMTQTAAAKLCGVSLHSISDYEAGRSEPKLSILESLSEHGFDALYILTGNRTPDVGDISSDELELIKIYRAAPLAVKAAALAALTAGSSASAGSINVTGSGQRVAGRDYHEGKK
ncbi:helix-turn-helix domain-containing protein [Dickeya zeae]|uniref:helix-turn-helix domain-containing protein n=1 Tax=Dickeya zeae TaxID=204042 RepID=UPI00206BA262|nr:helix-turn-helix domain-containing protein [Dickeya zeae]UPT55492.1 helix-turn-helix domain-containing protein [Dickeya zeae]